jgi:hypothetical protein
MGKRIEQYSGGGMSDRRKQKMSSHFAISEPGDVDLPHQMRFDRTFPPRSWLAS